MKAFVSCDYIINNKPSETNVDCPLEIISRRIYFKLISKYLDAILKITLHKLIGWYLDKDGGFGYLRKNNMNLLFISSEGLSPLRSCIQKSEWP
jgi:hypothetical protein